MRALTVACASSAPSQLIVPTPKGLTIDGESVLPANASIACADESLSSPMSAVDSSPGSAAPTTKAASG